VEKTGRSDANSQELITRSPCGKPGKSLRERVDTCLWASPHTFPLVYHTATQHPRQLLEAPTE